MSDLCNASHGSEFLAMFQGTNMVNAKGSNGHYRSWCKEENFCRAASKSLGFLKNRRSSPPEIARKCQISKFYFETFRVKGV